MNGLDLLLIIAQGQALRVLQGLLKFCGEFVTAHLATPLSDDA